MSSSRRLRPKRRRSHEPESHSTAPGSRHFAARLEEAINEQQGHVWRLRSLLDAVHKGTMAASHGPAIEDDDAVLEALVEYADTVHLALDIDLDRRSAPRSSWRRQRSERKKRSMITVVKAMSVEHARCLAMAYELHRLLGEVNDRPGNGEGSAVESALNLMEDVVEYLEPPVLSGTEPAPLLGMVRRRALHSLATSGGGHEPPVGGVAEYAGRVSRPVRSSRMCAASNASAGTAGTWLAGLRGCDKRCGIRRRSTAVRGCHQPCLSA